MNELQEFTSTLDLDLDIEEKKRLIREWKEINKWDSVKLVKGNDVANQGANVTSTNANAPKVNNTDLDSSDGVSPLPGRTYIDRVANEKDFQVDFELIPERKGKDRTPFVDFNPEDTEEVLKTLPNNSLERTQYYIDNKLKLDDSINKDIYDQSIGNVKPKMFDSNIAAEFMPGPTRPYFADWLGDPELEVASIPWEYNLNTNNSGVDVTDAPNLDMQFRYDNTAEWFKQNYDFDPSSTTGRYITEEVTGKDGTITEKEVYQGPQGYVEGSSYNDPDVRRRLNLDFQRIEMFKFANNAENNGWKLEGNIFTKEGEKDIEFNLNPTKETMIQIGAMNQQYKKTEVSYTDYLDKFSKENSLEILNPYLFFNPVEEGEVSFVDNFYGGAEALQQTGVNPYDFEGFLNKNGYINNFLEDLNQGVFEETFQEGIGDTLYNAKRDKERQLRLYLNEYISIMDQRTSLRQIIPDLKKENIKVLNPKGQLKSDLSKLGNYTDISYDSLDNYNQKYFNESYKADLEYRNKNQEYRRTLDQRGDLEAGVYNVFSSLNEGRKGLTGGIEDLINFSVDLLGGDDTLAKQKILFENETALANANMSYTNFSGLTAEVDGIEYAKDEQGQLYNTTVGYIIEAGTLNKEKEKLINEAIDKSKIKKRHYSLRGYLNVGGYVGGNVVSQVIGLKGAGYLTNAVKLRALATANGFASVAKYKNYAKLATLISGGPRVGNLSKLTAMLPAGVGKPLKYIAKKSTVDAIGTQAFIGGYIGYNETLKAARDAGFSNAEAEDLADSASQSMMALFAITGPISTRANWFNNTVAKQNLQKQTLKELIELKAAQTAGEKNILKRWTQDFRSGLMKLRATAAFQATKTRGGLFLYEGSKETVQENTQQIGQYKFVNAQLNTETGVDFLQDTYTNEEIITTSILSFVTGGLLSQIQVPDFKPRSEAALANYTYIGRNAEGAKKHLQTLIDQGLATQEEVDELLNNARAVYNQSANIPDLMLEGNDSVELAVILQEIADLKIKKKTYAEAFHPDIDTEIAALQESAEGLVADAVFAKTAKLTEGAKTIAGQTKTEFIDAETQEEVDIEIKKLQDRGAKIDEKNSSDYGTFLTLEDGSKVIILNKAEANKDFVMTTANHETGHNLLYETFKNRPEVAIAFGKAVLQEIESGKNLTFNNEQFKLALMEYVNDTKSYSEAGVAEEIITLLSEGLDPNNNWVTFNETGITKLGDIVRRALSALGIKVRFNKGIDVINFIRDYNKSIEANSGLSLGMQTTALEGGKGKLTKADKDSNQTIREDITKSYDNKVTVFDEDGSLKSIDIDSFNPDSQEILSIDNDTRSSKKRAPSLALKYKEGNITGDEMGDFYNEYLNIALSPTGLAFDSRTKIEGKQAITRDEAKSFVGQFFPDIMKRWNPDKEANISTWITANVRPKRADFYGKEQKLEEKGRQTSMSDERLGEIASTDTDSQPRETTKKTKTVDIRKFTAVKPKIEEIENAVVVKPEQVSSLTYKSVADNYVGPVGKALTGLSSAKITGNETLNYGIENNDASKLQILFQNTQEVVDFIAAMPKFNVATNESIINDQGEIIDATSDAKGYSLGINPSLIRKYYKRFTDPTGKMTSKSGRSKGKTSQPNVFKLDLTPTVANARKIQKDIGITPSGEMNIPIKGPARTEFGTTLQGLSKMYVSNLANTIARKKAKELLKTLKTAKDPKKIIADIGAGKSDVLASKKRRGTRDFNTIVREAGGKALNSKNLNVDSSKMPKIILDYLKNNPITVLDENEIDITKNWTENLEKDLDKLFKSKENFKDFDEKFSEIKQKYPELNKKKIKDAITKSFFSTIKANADVLKYREFVRKKLFPIFPKSFFTSGTFAGAGTAGPSRNFFYYSIGDLDLDNNEFAAEDSDIAAAVTRVGYTTGSGELRKITENWYTNEFLTGNQEILNKKKLIGLKKIFKVFETLLKDKNNVPFVAALLSSTSQGMGGFVRASAPITFVGNNLINGIVEEHTMPASFVAKYLFEAAIDGTVDADFKNINKNYQQGALGKLDDNKLKGFNNGIRFNYTQKMPDGWEFSDSVWDRYFNLNTASQNGGIDGRDYTMANGKTLFETLNVTSSGLKVDVKTVSSMKRAQVHNSKMSNVVNKNHNTQKQVNTLENIDKALAKGRSLDTPEKGISVFDFDDTLAKTNSSVIVTMPNGKKTKINATQFAKNSIKLEEKGAKFDFSEFNKVIDGKKGPLFDLAQKRKGKFGNKDIFILTARPQLAAPEIYEFLKKIGLEIPLANITGLENGSPQAKADWIIDKAAKGYNNFYFADDAVKNVKAVKNVLEQIDVKSKVQLALASKKRTFDSIINNIIESSTGIKNYKTYSEARAKVEGKKNNKTSFFIPPSAEDFTGLLYRMLGKGKVGDVQFQFFKDNLLDPYNRAEIAVTQAKISAANDFKALKKNLKTLPKKLSKQTGVGKFSFGQAVRVAIWTRQGMKIPGLSKTDANKLNAFINKDKELSMFVNELINIQKGKSYPKPGDNWTAGTIINDITNGINKVNRKEYLQEFVENSDIIFSNKNMNKLEAAYGSKYVEALRDSLRRMKSGSNRPIGGSRVVNEVLDWLNNSVGTVMFLNRRSGILQTISAVNFIDFGDNNIFKAGKAFSNQKQFWSDFMTLINSPYLVERRDGLKINVSESEIADAVAESDNKVKAAISYLLNKGFVFTRYADSFAIASGGATFYRNRLEALKKQGMTEEQAKKQAFEDFRAIAETNQQSSSPSKISQQQASAAGRVILAFANTPMQYARIQKRAIQDLINGRGDWKANISKITYYGIIQNLIFNALQNALFLMLFDDEEEEQESKTGRIANGMADSLLRGLGIQGAAVAALKNVIIKIYQESEKPSTKYREAVFEAFDFSPPLDSKVRRLRAAGKSYDWNMKEIREEGFNLNNPAYLANAQIISATTNIPVDRAVSDVNALRQIFSGETENWQKVALALGWSTWDVGLPYYGVNKEPIDTPQTRLKNKVDLIKKETSTKEQKLLLLDLGLTKQQVKDLKYEDDRVKKIIELENKYKDDPQTRDSLVNVNTLKRELNALNKPEQVKSLIELGLSTEEIKELKYEIDRVNKIIELQNKK